VSAEQGFSVCDGLLHMRISDVSSNYNRLANRRQLMVSRHRRSTFGRRAFSVAGPMEWKRFQILSGTLLGVPTASDRLWRLISSQR